MKLTKQETKLYQKANDLIYSDKRLTFDEKCFIINNWIPDANHNVTESGAFFTPLDLAFELAVAYYNEPVKTLDLCAGIGVLSFVYFQKMVNTGLKAPEVTCVEINPIFVEVGKRIFPEANWVLANVLDTMKLFKPKSFDGVLSNPPYGNIPQQYKRKGRWEYEITEISLELANTVLLILPQGCLNWRYSGFNRIESVSNDFYDRWSQKTGILLENALSVDTIFAAFHSTAIKVELVNAIKTQKKLDSVICDLPLFQVTTLS